MKSEKNPAQNGGFSVDKTALKMLRDGALLLAQTDTTLGFCSTSEAAINAAKGRQSAQKCIFTLASCAAVGGYMRVPHRAKNYLRRAKKTTIATQNRSVRVVRDCAHAKALAALAKAGINGLYSSSANAHGAGFCEDFALQAAELIEDDFSRTFRPISRTFRPLKSASERASEQQTPCAREILRKLNRPSQQQASKILLFRGQKIKKLR